MVAIPNEEALLAQNGGRVQKITQGPKTLLMAMCRGLAGSLRLSLQQASDACVVPSATW